MKNECFVNMFVKNERKTVKSTNFKERSLKVHKTPSGKGSYIFDVVCDDDKTPYC